MIIPVYKPYGVSTHRLAERVGKVGGQKATHTGTLDPAAEGVIVVLTADDRFDKEKHANSIKEYTAELLLGVDTDTHDLLGLARETGETASINSAVLLSTLQSLEGEYLQQLPTFSARRIKGESYFDLAQREVQFEPASEKVNVERIELISKRTISIDQLETDIYSKISQIRGNFRQKDILVRWQMLLSKFKNAGRESFAVISIQVRCSKRTYIRALVRDFSQQVGIPTVLYSLIRTKNGPYTIADCICLL